MLHASFGGAIGSYLSGVLGAGFLIGLAIKYIPAFAGHQLDEGLHLLMAHLHRKEDIAAAKAVLAAVNARIPLENDASLQSAVDALVAYEPALKPVAPQLLELLRALDAVAKKSLNDASTPQPEP